ncbi:MAG: hypothetical protein RL326_1105 [Pseudomonadota bacterium]|jgi:hypothetical protein
MGYVTSDVGPNGECMEGSGSTRRSKSLLISSCFDELSTDFPRGVALKVSLTVMTSC